MSLSTLQERVLAITPKCTSSLSMPCSVFIIYEVWCDHRRGRSNAIQRAIVGMSAIDVMSSSGWFLSSWMVPKGSFALSRGNRGTCTYQGFLLQLAVGAPLYNCSLALFYLLVIKYRWSDQMLEGIEKWVHGFILFFSIGTSIALVPLEQYNHIGAVCWVIGDPAECGNSSYTPSDVPCERGNHAWLFGVLLFYGPLWVCILACVTSMVVIYRQVHQTIRRLERYSVHGSNGRSHTGRSEADASRVATQAILYSLSFLFTWMPSTLWSIAHWFNWKTFWLDFLAGFCEPMQGFLNLLIFARKRKATKRKIKFLLSKVFPCWCKLKAQRYNQSFIRSMGISTNFSSNNISDMDTPEPYKGDENEQDVFKMSVPEPIQAPTEICIRVKHDESETAHTTDADKSSNPEGQSPVSSDSDLDEKYPSLGDQNADSPEAPISVALDRQARTDEAMEKGNAGGAISDMSELDSNSSMSNDSGARIKNVDEAISDV